MDLPSRLRPAVVAGSSCPLTRWRAIAGGWPMKKLINRPDAVVEEMIEGLVAVDPGLERLPGQLVVVRADAAEGRARRVALISGGGSGHEPAHAGYVGRGMLGAAVAGDVFTSP